MKDCFNLDYWNEWEVSLLCQNYKKKWLIVETQEISNISLKQIASNNQSNQCYQIQTEKFLHELVRT